MLAANSVPEIRRWTEPTPALALPSLAGKPVDLKDLRGRVVLVNFWATWCEPCRDEMPSLAGLRERFPGQPLEVLFVNYGEHPERVRRFLDREKLVIDVLLDRDQEAASRWKAKGLPMTFLVDARGQVRYWAFGERDWAFGDARQRIEELLAEASRGRR